MDTLKLMRGSFTVFCLFLFVHYNAQSWTLLSPLKLNSEVRGCSFLDEQNGFAALLSEGLILLNL